MGKFEVLKTNHCAPDGVKTSFLVHASPDFTKPVVAKSVHETVQHGGRGGAVNSVLAVCVEVVFFDIGEYSSYKG